MKVYRAHYCSAAHRSYRTMAECMFPRAHWVKGEGSYASVSRCRGTTVALYKTQEAAQDAKRIIDSSLCGGACWGSHEIILIELPGKGNSK